MTNQKLKRILARVYDCEEKFVEDILNDQDAKIELELQNMER
jgi:hypothetical protein